VARVSAPVKPEEECEVSNTGIQVVVPPWRSAVIVLESHYPLHNASNMSVKRRMWIPRPFCLLIPTTSVVIGKLDRIVAHSPYLEIFRSENNEYFNTDERRDVRLEREASADNTAHDACDTAVI